MDHASPAYRGIAMRVAREDRIPSMGCKNRGLGEALGLFSLWRVPDRSVSRMDWTRSPFFPSDFTALPR